MSDFIKHLSNPRYRKITAMIYGFVLKALLLGAFKRFRSKESHERKLTQMISSQAKIFVKTATDMGGLLIKLGQHISARADILPEEITKELSKLQDSVAPVGFDEIKAALEKELGKPIGAVFSAFDEVPIASASLGQVYSAELSSGEKLAVKILRPGIEDVIQIDLKALELAAHMKFWTSLTSLIDVDALYKEFKDTILDELDLHKEGKNAEEFAEMFSDRDDVLVPKIYWEISTKRILSMSFMDGAKINNIPQLKEWSVDLHKAAVSFFEIYIRQVLQSGFFHADPHPGNVLVQPDGKIVLLDFGMVGRIPSDMKKNLLSMLMAVYLKDTEGAVETLKKLKFLKRNTDLEIFKQSLEHLFELILGESDDMSFFESKDTLDEFRIFLYTQPFQIPANTMFLGKAVGTVYGICKELDSDFDFYRSAKPYIQNFVIKDLGSYANVVVDGGKKAVKKIIPTAKKFVSIVDKLDNGNLKINLSAAFEKKLIETQNKNARRIICMMFGGVMTVSGLMLYQGGDTVAAYIAGSIGALTMLVQLARVRKG